MTPQVSVILPTYNWSAALRCSIRSALEQTFRDFELLVIGDGCTDDSESVVRSFGDPRIVWVNLPSNSGNQVAPNNRGLSMARGRYVAYLGHDDVWHPRHLESLVATAERTGADVVGAIASLQGPPGSGVRALTGVFAGGPYHAGEFLPPSSLLHTGALIEKIGPWKRAADLELPTDAELLRRAFHAGAKIVSTGELTVFKFNAAWRRNVYLDKSAAEQEEMLRRISTEPDLRERELIETLRSVVEDRFQRVAMPETGGVAKGEIARWNARYKGVAAKEPPRRLEGRTRLDLDDQTPGFEWHGVERHERFGSYRWSGPSPVFTLEFPLTSDHEVDLRVHIVFSLLDDLPRKLELLVNGAPAALTIEKTGEGTQVVHTRIAPPRPHLRIAFRLPETRQPWSLRVGPDRRWLGIAVNWVEAAPAESVV